MLRHELERMRARGDEYQRLYFDLLEKFTRLERGLLQSKSERKSVVDEQLGLALVAMSMQGEASASEQKSADEQPPASEEPSPEAPPKVRRPTGRKTVAATVGRYTLTLLPPEVEREGTDAFERIGEVQSEVIERRRGGVVVVRTTRPKFVRKSGSGAGEVLVALGSEDVAKAESAAASAVAVQPDITSPAEVLIAPPADLPIPKGLAGPGFLAETIVRRWADHLPLNRLEGIYAREGLELSRSTLCQWHDSLSTLVAPLLEAMWAHAREQPLLLTDATGVGVQAPRKCKTGHFFVVIAPELHVLYAFSPKHDGKAIRAILGNFKGYLTADAHSIYDHLYAQSDSPCVEVACWAHARRYFFKSISTDPERSRIAIDRIGQLFAIERELAGKPPATRKAARQQRSRAVVDAFFTWCTEQRSTVLDGAPITKALTYALNQKEALKRFLDDGRLPLHNNDSERALRRQAVGRKNWLFLGSEDGGKANARFVSLLASCQLHEIEPWAYLRDLFCLLPDWNQTRVLELAPAFWKTTSARADVQHRLQANPFRRITESEDSTGAETDAVR